jgi:hypothetical protein
MKEEKRSKTFLGIFAIKNCKNAPISSTVSVCLSVCMNGTTQELLNKFSWNFKNGRFTKIYKHIPILVKINKNKTGKV